MKLRSYLIPISFCLFATPALCAVDPATGARASLASVQTTLAAPSLPSLEVRDPEYGVQAAYITQKFEGEFDKGKLSGGGGGLNHSTRERDYLRYYAMIVGNSIKGELEIADAPDIEDFKASGAAIAVGAAYRVFGEQRSFISVGVFGGPAAMYFDGSFKIQGITFFSQPVMFGGYGGVQIRMRLSQNWRLTPYGVSMLELSPKCKKMDSTVGPVMMYEDCAGDFSSVPLPANFLAYGFVLGYKRLQLNVYSKLINHASMRDLQIQHYTLSYSF